MSKGTEKERDMRTPAWKEVLAWQGGRGGIPTP